MGVGCLYSYEFVVAGGLSHLPQILIACLVQMLVLMVHGMTGG